jgi:hypothetical protein
MTSEHETATGRPAVSETDQERLLANIAARLPYDYLEMAGAAGGFRIHDWEVLGLEAVHRATLKEGDFYLLAKSDERQKAIGVRAKAETPEVYLLDYGGLAPEQLGTSFEAALEAVLAAPEPPR